MKNLSDWKVFQNRNSDFKKIAYFDNPHSIMDNVARVSLIILYALTAYILLTGGIYHYEIFQTSMGNGAISIILSLGFFAVIEVLKVFFGTYFMRGILSGDAGESKIHITTYSILFAVCVFGFWWSWNISTDAAPTLNKIIKISEGKSRHTDSSEVKVILSDIAAIDAQIGTANASEKEGFANRYRGVVTENGQIIAKRAANTRDKLTDQRTALLSRLNNEKDRIRTATSEQMSAASTQLSQYGGFAEVLQIIFLLLTALCEAISYMKTKKDIAEGKIQNPIKKPVGFQDLLSPYAQNNTTSNTPHSEQPLERQPIGFKINQTPTPSVKYNEKESKKSVATDFESVATDLEDILDPTLAIIIDGLKKQKKDINAWCSKWEQGSDTVKKTAENNIFSKWQEIRRLMKDYPSLPTEFKNELLLWKQLRIDPILSVRDKEANNG